MHTYYKMPEWEGSTTYVVFIPYFYGWRKWSLQRMNGKPLPIPSKLSPGQSHCGHTLHLSRSQFNHLIKKEANSIIAKKINVNINNNNIYWKILRAKHSFKHSTCVNYKLTLAIDTCHLPLRRLNYEPLQLLTFNTPWKEFRVEIRNEALCALGKTGRTGLQMVRYFQEKILWAQFLHLLISRKALKSFMVISASRD